MTLVDTLRGLLNWYPKTADGIKITPEIADKLDQLGIKNGFTREEAAAVLAKYPEKGFETISKWTEGSRLWNNGLAYHFLMRYGPQKVNEVVDRYGPKSSENLGAIIRNIEKHGVNVVDETFERFGLRNMDSALRYYERFGPDGIDMTQKIIDEYGDGLFVFIDPIYDAMEKAKKTKASDEIKQYNLRFIGEVQGVDFRSHSWTYAKILGINGWVRNESDGSVLCEVQGTDPIIGCFVKGLEHIHRISGVIKKETEVTPLKKGYEISGESIA